MGCEPANVVFDHRARCAARHRGTLSVLELRWTITGNPENLNVFVDPVGNLAVEKAIRLQFHLQSVANQFFTLVDDLSHTGKSDRGFPGGKEPDGRLRCPGKEFFHSRYSELQINGPVARFDGFSPMGDVAISAIQVAGTRH